MEQKIVAIVNPASNGGRTGKNWAELHLALDQALNRRTRTPGGPVEARFTADRGQAIDLTREALRNGATQIIAVGGDGTTNEVVNGFFAEDGTDTVINPHACLSLLMAGTGGDFRRTFSLETQQDFIDGIANGTPRPLDIGRCDFVAHDGIPTHRYFDNILSFGMSGDVCMRVDDATWQKRLGGTFTYNWAIGRAFLAWRNRPVQLVVDGKDEGIFAINTLAICNGRYFGSGLLPAPHADPFDGLLDITCIADTNLIDVATSAGAMRNGTVLDHKRVTFRRGRNVEIIPQGDSPLPLPFEIDGETPGLAPATVRLLPGAITLKI
ncbi:MAG: diacylglycerol/lipid kinase family protein [Alphaproteobacteria bacterium]